MHQATRDAPDAQRPEYRYHRLRAASTRFQCAVADLEPWQRTEVERQAEQTWALESLVLSSAEARDTLIPERQIAAAVAEIQRRYPDRSAFLEDLARNGLDEGTLGRALRRELIFDAVMHRIGAQAAPVSEDDARRFHAAHRERFLVPERRQARHILITVNAEYAENTREAARARLEILAARLRTQPTAFGQLARRHSECPTALEDGRLGTLPRGRLYPELEAVLFELAEGQISDPVESEIGFHLLWCERIEPARAPDFAQVRARIRAHLESHRRHEQQRAWIAHLRQAQANTTA